MSEGPPEVLRQIKEFEDKLKALGVAPDAIPAVAALLDERQLLQADLEHYREMQFYDDASEVFYRISGRGANKVDNVARFLRAFAEHVTRAVADDSHDVRSMVDQIPTMTEREKRE